MVSKEQIEECRELLAFLERIKPIKQHTIMKKKFQITSIQLVWENGQRDTVRLAMPVETTDIETYRSQVLAKHRCKVVNLTYVTMYE